jgi:hypothetical protein
MDKEIEIDIRLTKPRSRTIIHFITDVDDPWFINIRYETKKGVVTRISYVTQGRYMDWLDSYLDNGWVVDSE